MVTLIGQYRITGGNFIPIDPLNIECLLQSKLGLRKVTIAIYSSEK